MTSSRILRIILVSSTFFVTSSSAWADAPQLEGDELLAWWAYEQFAAAGLSLVDLELRFSDDKDHCDDNLGVHQIIKGVHVIDVCDPHRPRRKHTLLHELAHVWISENIDQATRDEFMELRELTVWNSVDTPWSDRGTEHAAEILSWGIGDHPCWFRPSLNPGDDDTALTLALAVLIDTTPRCDTEAAEPRPPRSSQLLP